MLIIHFLMIWAGALCAFWLIELIALLCEKILSPLFGLRINSLSFFGHNFEKSSIGKWSHSRGRFSLLIHHRTAVDLSNEKHRFDQERKWTLPTIEIIVLALISLGMMFIFFPSVYRSFYFEQSYLDTFLAMMSIGTLVSTVVVTLNTLRMRMNSGNSLEWYTDVLIQRIRDGEPLSSLDLRPVDSLPYKSSSTRTRDLYNRVYMLYLISERRTEEMPIPMNDMTANMRNSKSFSLEDTGTFYTLVFYYSRYKYDPVLAKEFLERVRDRIAVDTDANARRVLAYYAYCIEGDRQKARFFIDQAAAVVDTFSTGSEREIEKRLITELDASLRADGC